ncbi:12365_t:CDS:2 [Funneliformis geosporum]|uniref:19038_t:CDS:1 n=1 Tax=Funneliformis geosporum TaxID=1117311 RepID=A0A9W4WXW0_9GLOM|nr:12365_t:CDS:2 [Funneliformis geosporum]CAI2180395.1 19038_t:CDS:2 [Funneliformis geosporum]
MELDQTLPSYLLNTPFDLYNRKTYDVISLPSKLNKSDCANELTIEDDEVTMFYNGTHYSYTAAAVRANNPFPVEAGLFYFETYIINQGLYGLIGIGMGDANVTLNGQPGWYRRSYGYHGDDGKMFMSNGFGYEYGPLYTTNDVIGVAFDDILGGNLYPIFGMRNPRARIEVNFGQKPFVFDIETYAKKMFRVANEEDKWVKLSDVYTPIK